MIVQIHTIPLQNMLSQVISSKIGFIRAIETKEKIDSMLEKIAPTEVKKRMTASQLNLIFANYVKKIAIVVLFTFKLHTAIL